MKNYKNIILGLILILIGIVVGTNSLGITNINIFFAGWWTLFIIVPCFIGLLSEDEKTGNIIGLLIGISLLLCCQNVLDFDLIWKLALPVALIIIGLSFVFKDTFNHKISSKIKELNSKETSEGYCSTFTGQNIKLGDEKFTGTDLTAIFGGIKFDMTSAKLEKESVINASSIFGGIEIYVPENVEVKIKSSSIFGGVSDKRKNISRDEKNKTLYINATCIFGGVEIKWQKPKK